VVGLRNARCRVCNLQASVALNDREFRVTEWISLLNGEHWRGPSNNDVPPVPAEGIGVVGHHAHSEHSTQAHSRLMGLGKVSGSCGGLYAWVQAPRACDEKGSRHPDLREPGAMDTCNA
jgi:hypothetical protein